MIKFQIGKLVTTDSTFSQNFEEEEMIVYAAHNVVLVPWCLHPYLETSLMAPDIISSSGTKLEIGSLTSQNIVEAE